MSPSPRDSLLAELSAADPSATLCGDGGVRVERIACDVRDVGPGTLFAALDGAPHRGHARLADAVRAGAVAVLAGVDPRLGVPAVVSSYPAASLALMAAAHEGHPSRELSVVAVTGTDGKTTTACFVDAVLRAAGRGSGCISTVGVHLHGRLVATPSRLSTPEAPELQAQLRAMREAGADWAVVEATSHGLALDRLAGTHIAVAAVTNVTHEHLDFHGTPAAYRQAKGRLLALSAAQGGVAVVNADDPGALSLLEHAAGARVVRYSAAGGQAEVRAARVNGDGSGSRFRLEAAGAAPVPVRLRLPGGFNVANALCAAACATAAGVPADAIAAGLESVAAVPGRMTSVDAGQPFAVVVDYAHTPAALEQVLTLLRAEHRRGRLIAVFGSAGERDVLKRPWMGEVAARLADQLVITTEDPRSEEPAAALADIAAGARAAGAVEGRTFVRALDRREAIRHALLAARPGDCVLLAGKGHERSMVWGTEERPWDEAAVAREVLAELGLAAGPAA